MNHVIYTSILSINQNEKISWCISWWIAKDILSLIMCLIQHHTLTTLWHQNDSCNYFLTYLLSILFFYFGVWGWRSNVDKLSKIAFFRCKSQFSTPYRQTWRSMFMPVWKDLVGRTICIILEKSMKNKFSKWRLLVLYNIVKC